jgi:hypothetical protein
LLGQSEPKGRLVFESNLYGRILWLRGALFGVRRSLSVVRNPTVAPTIIAATAT